MITQALLNLLFTLFGFVLGFLPFMDFSFDTSAFATMFDVIKSISFFFPMGTVSAIFLIIVAIMGFRIAVAILKTLWQILPFV